MMDRRTFVCAVAGSFLATPLTAVSQPAGKVYRIGHLSGSGQAASKPFVEAFLQGLRKAGYVDGASFVLDERYAEGNVQRLPALARELVDGRPDVLLASTTPGNLAAKAATTTIPIVMVLVADPVGAGIVTTLARPGGNITGITNIVAELAGKRLEILKEMIPNAAHIAVLVNPDSQNAPLQMQSAATAARRLGLELGPVIAVRNAGDLEKGIESAARMHAPAAIRMIDPLVFMLRNETAALAAKHRLPMIYPSSEDAEAGGLVAYGTNVPEQYRHAATLVDKILKGARPGDLPVEQPTKFDLVINLKTAKALGLTIPQSLLIRADVLIQ